MMKRNVTFGNMVKFLCILLCLSFVGTVSAQVQFLEESTVTTNGLYFYYADGSKAYHYNPNISPRGDCVSVVNGYMFFGWFKGGMTNRKLMISRKKIGSGNWVSVEFSHRNTLIGQGWGDSHKTISVGVSKIDGTVHIFYDHHNDPLKYIVSKKNIAFAPDSEFKLSNFEATRGWLATGQDIRITYPKITQNEIGEIIVNYRKGSAVGGDETVHVYNGVEWTRSKQVSKGRLGDVAVNNYAYGVPYYNNGDVYYAFSVRWAAKQDDGVLNEGVYLAKCGPTFTDKWEDLNGNLHDLPIDDFSPFLIDDPASNAGKGSSGGPGLVVSENGDIHVTYDGRGSGNTYEYTYTRKADESTFTKHQGVKKTGLSWNNRFYTIGASGKSIRITSGEPGSLNYTTELVHTTNRNFGNSSSYIADGKLILIVAENKQSDKKDIYSYVFQLPVAAPVVQDVDGGDWDVASTWNPDGVPASTNSCTTDMNLYVNNAASPFSGSSLRVLPGGQLHLRDSENPFVVDNLIMAGGEVYAGTGNNNSFALAGHISVISNTVFRGYWDAAGPRNLSILSQINGGAVITSMAADQNSTHTLTIGNAANDFSGTWVAQNGVLEFANAGAVGGADVQVLEYGELTLQGDWSGGGMLDVADAPTAAVNLGAYNWTVPSLMIGGVSVDYGTYSVAALNALGNYPVFTGSGTISVVDSSIVTMDVLGSPQTWSTAGIWSNDQAPAAGFVYFIPDTGNLKSLDGNSTFSGDALTVEAGGKFQFRSKHESGQTTTVNNLIATGGTPEKFVNLAAGTGNNTANHLGGTLTNDGFTILSGYGNATGPRNVRISSVISGNGTLHSTGTPAYPHTCTIVNENNTFAGTWESNIGTLLFTSGAAVGAADISVLPTGKLSITDDWVTTATLSVADSVSAEVNLGSRDWTVSALSFGATTVAEGVYTAAELNDLGVNAVFIGTGSIRVGDLLPPPVYELVAGWDIWSSADAPDASVLAPGVTGSAVTTSAQTSWNTTDERGASNDGTWGTHAGLPVASTGVVDGENLTLPNAASSESIVFTLTNNGVADIKLGSFHFDAYAFRPKAPRTYALSVVAGGGISSGSIYESAADAITSVGGANANDAHDNIDIDLTGLVDNKLEVGESVEFLLAFSGGAGDGAGGHHLFVDNVGITGATLVPADQIAPTVDAGSGRVLTLPTDALNLPGTASDNMVLASTVWTQEAGPNTAVLSGDTTLDLNASGLVEGSYIFRLTATDGGSNSAYDEVNVLVVQQPTPENVQAMYLQWTVDQGMASAETNPSLDLDGDGFSNMEEFLSGHDPRNAASAFSVESIQTVDDVAGEVLIEWVAQPNRIYRVLQADSPGGEYRVIADGIVYPQTRYSVDIGGSEAGYLKVDVRLQ